MQSFAIVFAIFVLATVANAASVGSSQQVVAQNIQQTLTEEGSLNAPSELARLKKSAYGGASVPNVPCPKNYLFSCQPNVAPVPCAQQSYAGAYSAPVPTYALPQAHREFAPELIRPAFTHYNQYYY